ncbi:MAG: tRNA (N6-threonylcarbamoyladenosine(37)-N6)-methyltransferase TrmO [Myxococcota bacterium]
MSDLHREVGGDARVVFTPIGVVRSPHREKADAPRQPRAAEGARGTLELFAGRGYEDGLADLEGWDGIWALFVFDRATGWRPKVRPPRSATKRGVFATRAPHRPNPLGMSLLRLLRVEGRFLHVEGLDVLDGTPLLDVKPYVPWADAWPDARTGWLRPEAGSDERGRPRDPGPIWEVRFTAHALAQLAFLEERGVSLRGRAEAQLSLGPQPHAYRRIRPEGEGFVLSIKSWRLAFRTVNEREKRTIEVVEVRSGEKAKRVHDDAALAIHAAFRTHFSCAGS